MRCNNEKTLVIFLAIYVEFVGLDQIQKSKSKYTKSQETKPTTQQTLEEAIEQGLVKRGAIIHSDRGSQYASNGFRDLLRKNCFQQSMSGKGNYYDNAQAESSFSRFKAELIEDGLFDDIEQARSEIFSYLELKYLSTCVVWLALFAGLLSQTDAQLKPHF